MIYTEVQLQAYEAAYGGHPVPGAAADLIETIRALRDALGDLFDEMGRCSASCEECDKIEKLLGREPDVSKVCTNRP